MESVFKITESNIYTTKITTPLDIDVIGDIHYGMQTSLDILRRINIVLRRSNPDYVLLVGDNLDTTNPLYDPFRREKIMEFFKSLGRIAPTLVSLADHDSRRKTATGAIYDFQADFWQQVNRIPNVNVLHNKVYEDNRIRVVGYTQPSHYFHAKYPLPENVEFNGKRKDESVALLLEDMNRHADLFREKRTDKPQILQFHSAVHTKHEEVQTLLQNFDQIYSGHTHQGVIPPILDEIIPGNGGFISPQKTLFPKIARGVFETYSGSIVLITGGIITIQESAHRILQPFQKVFPMRYDRVHLVKEPLENGLNYSQKSYYKRIK